MSEFEVDGAPFLFHKSIHGRLEDLDNRVREMRAIGRLDSRALERIQEFFKIKGIYHSNAIEGNSLTVGETELVVNQGFTITGKTLADQAEAINLGHALDFMKEIATASDAPITERDVRQIHALILAGIQDDHAGSYRNTEVRIRGSQYEPTEAFAVPHQMSHLGKYVTQITKLDSPIKDFPIVSASAAHAWLAQIHPFVDGNGRTARILMNLILVRRGYTICIISHDDRLRYYDALEESQAGDLTPLIELVYENVEESLEEWERAAEEQKTQREWLASVTARFQQPELNKAQNEYEVWRRGMDLFKSYVKQTVDDWNDQLIFGSVSLKFKDFGTLGFEKYVSLRNGRSAKKTWDFGLEFRRGNSRVRYLFYYGFADYRMRHRARVVLFVAKQIDHTYVQLGDISGCDKPDFYQVGFDMKDQTFVASRSGGDNWDGKVEALARHFFEQVVERDFGV